MIKFVTSGLFDYIEEKDLKKSEDLEESNQILEVESKYFYEIPYTDGEAEFLTACNAKKSLQISTPTIVYDQLNAPLIRYYKQIIPKKMLSTLDASTEDLRLTVPPHEAYTARGHEFCLHLGNWRKYSKKPFETVDSEENHSQNWISLNQPLAKLCSKVFEQSFPILYKKYTTVNAKDRIFGAWTTCAINFNFACNAHYDEHDYRGGLCWIVPFGNYTEGRSLFFPHLNIDVLLQPGDLVCFRSYELKHQVKKYNNVRNSLVFFTHHNMFFPSCN